MPALYYATGLDTTGETILPATLKQISDLWKVSGKDTPENIPELRVAFGKSTLMGVIQRLFPDKAEAEIKALFPAGKVALNGQEIKVPEQEINIAKGDILKIGDRNFFEVVAQP